MWRAAGFFAYDSYNYQYNRDKENEVCQGKWKIQDTEPLFESGALFKYIQHIDIFFDANPFFIQTSAKHSDNNLHSCNFDCFLYLVG
jgi:hypothetical protein